jgi:uncharacterized membrane protein YraQ (UPF0718 family)
MDSVIDKVIQGVENAFLMAWQVWWALVLGFALSAIVQAWVPQERIQRALGGAGARPVAVATGLGAASSSCSYAAIAIAKSLFAKGASAASALAFQFASTNLVIELGAVVWVLLGWQFTLAEFLGGLVLVVVMTALLRLFVSRRLERRAREHAQHAATGHQHSPISSSLPLRERLTSGGAWSDVAHNFRNDWSMVWREILIGFLLAGFIGLLGNGFFEALFIHNSNHVLRTLENVVVGPLVAVLSFVCSVGNVPLAAVLWSGGISFAGVVAFLFADLIVLPILFIYRRYYGGAFAARITALMLVSIVIAALAIDLLFTALGLVPTARPSRVAVFGSVSVDYNLFLNIFATAIFVALFALTLRHGATDPVCGMKVDRRRAPRLERDGRRYHFCSEHCMHEFGEPSERPVAATTDARHP